MVMPIEIFVRSLVLWRGDECVPAVHSGLLQARADTHSFRGHLFLIATQLKSTFAEKAERICLVTRFFFFFFDIIYGLKFQ